MSDVHDKQTRSFNMSRIRSKNTKPELIVRKFLFSNGFRFRIHVKSLPGTPDIVLPKYKAVIFIHGCFWHGHENCRYFVVPKTRTDWWLNKIRRNKQLDSDNFRNLTKQGWKIITIFGCELKQHIRNQTLKRIETELLQ